jgi:DNA-binding NarL/FixJ family response regulator
LESARDTRYEDREAERDNSMNEQFNQKEREYLRFLAQGMSDKEIARRIGVTTAALSSGRIWGIKAKTGIKTRKEVVIYAQKHFA